MLVECVGQFLASSLQLLPQGEAVKHNSILKTENRMKELFSVSKINILKRKKQLKATVILQALLQSTTWLNKS